MLQIIGYGNEIEANELEKLPERSDRLMLRKAEAASILRSRGWAFAQKDFKPLPAS